MGWKMPVVLSCMFCLMINCLSACFDRISALSAGCGCGIRPVRGTRNFGRQNILSGNRCKFTSMFICTSLTHPCASVARYYLKFQVPLTVFIMSPKLTNRAVTFAYTGKIACLHTDLVNTVIRREIRKA